MERRSFMRLGFQSVTVAVAGSGAVGLLGACTPPPDPGTDMLVLLPGFTARVVAVSGNPVPSGSMREAPSPTPTGSSPEPCPTVREGPPAPGTELTGPAFDPSGTRLYFSSQRSPGVTYEVTGDWARF